MGGANYGQGSSREHAALVPLYLGVKAVVAKTFSRIHAANLINAGIIPLTFANPDDYDLFEQGQTLEISGLFEGLTSGKATLSCPESGKTAVLNCVFSERQAAILRAGGLLSYTKGE